MKQKIFENVAVGFFNFLRGQPFDVQKLKGYQVMLNGMQLAGEIEDNEYDFLSDLIETVVEFYS